MPDGINRQITLGRDSEEHRYNFPLLPKSGHFYFAKDRTFLLCLDKDVRRH
jgi:hypothetical protein